MAGVLDQRSVVGNDQIDMDAKMLRADETRRTVMGNEVPGAIPAMRVFVVRCDDAFTLFERFVEQRIYIGFGGIHSIAHSRPQESP